MTPLLEVSGIDFSFPTGFRLAVDAFRLAPGEHACISGGNGAGKSTFLRLLAGLILPATGSVRYGVGAPPSPADYTGRSPGRFAGYLPPLERGFYDRLSARENLLFYGRLQGLATVDVAARIPPLADRLGVADLLDRPLGRLSSGQRQRFNLARAFLHAPGVLLLDEPERGLDADGRERLAALVAERLAAGAAAVVATPLPTGPQAGSGYRFVDGRLEPHA